MRYKSAHAPSVITTPSPPRPVADGPPPSRPAYFRCGRAAVLRHGTLPRTHRESTSLEQPRLLWRRGGASGRALSDVVLLHDPRTAHGGCRAVGAQQQGHPARNQLLWLHLSEAGAPPPPPRVRRRGPRGPRGSRAAGRTVAGGVPRRGWQPAQHPAALRRGRAAACRAAEAPLLSSPLGSWCCFGRV